MKTGALAGVLPEVAWEEFRGLAVEEFPLAWLKPLARPMALAWNPRLAGVRPAVANAAATLEQLCKIGAG